MNARQCPKCAGRVLGEAAAAGLHADTPIGCGWKRCDWEGTVGDLLIPAARADMGRQRDQLAAEARDLRAKLSLIPPALLAAALGEAHGIDTQQPPRWARTYAKVAGPNVPDPQRQRRDLLLTVLRDRPGGTLVQDLMAAMALLGEDDYNYDLCTGDLRELERYALARSVGTPEALVGYAVSAK